MALPDIQSFLPELPSRTTVIVFVAACAITFTIGWAVGHGRAPPAPKTETDSHATGRSASSTVIDTTSQSGPTRITVTDYACPTSTTITVPGPRVLVPGPRVLVPGEPATCEIPPGTQIIRQTVYETGPAVVTTHERAGSISISASTTVAKSEPSPDRFLSVGLQVRILPDLAKEFAVTGDWRISDRFSAGLTVVPHIGAWKDSEVFIGGSVHF